MQYLGFDIGYGWWTPAASRAKPLVDAKVRHEDPKTGCHDVRSFIGACNFYRRHINNFTYTSAILTDLIKKTSTWRRGPQEQQAFDELKDKVASAKCLGVPRAQGEIVLVTDASNVGGGGTLFQWQAQEKRSLTRPFPNGVLMESTETVLSSTATLTTNGFWFPWVIGTGNGTRPGVTFDFTGHKVAKTRILSKWLTKLTHRCCVLSLF